MIKTILVNGIKKCFERRGLAVCDKHQVEVIARYAKCFSESMDNTGEDVCSIVFSKNRVMQLHAFLRSYVDVVVNPGDLYVLYLATDCRHRSSYGRLHKIFSGKRIHFIEEASFRDQFIDIVDCTSAGKVLIHVDDMLFFRRVDYDQIRKINTSTCMLALSRGSDLHYSVVLRKSIAVPNFFGKLSGFNCFRWDEGREFSDWTFPLELPASCMAAMNCRPC